MYVAVVAGAGVTVVVDNNTAFSNNANLRCRPRINAFAGMYFVRYIVVALMHCCRREDFVNFVFHPSATVVK